MNRLINTNEESFTENKNENKIEVCFHLPITWNKKNFTIYKKFCLE